MTVRADIAGVINNDLTYTFWVTYNGRPLDLTGRTVTVVIKPSQAALDSAGKTYGVGTGVTVISAVAGNFKLRIPRADVTVAGTTWYRVDLNDGTNLVSPMDGQFYLEAA